MFSSCSRSARALRNSRSASSFFTDIVRIVEVGARDGLQNIKQVLPTATKVELINRLSKTGLRSIEVTSFVSPKRVPQMADCTELYQSIEKNPNVEYSVLVPNLTGLEKALKLGVTEVEVFTAASETFTRKNINCSVEESLKNFAEIRKICKDKKIRTRGVVSCIAGCPYEGDVKPVQVAKVAEVLLDMGCYEVVLGDTIGVATPKKMALLLEELKRVTGGDVWRFAVHCHDTYGQAIANIYECLKQGIRVFDSSVAGLGGCPFAPGATGNVSTEDLVYLLHGEGLETGVDLDKLIETGRFISEQIPITNYSRVGSAMIAKRRGSQCN